MSDNGPVSAGPYVDLDAATVAFSKDVGVRDGRRFADELSREEIGIV
jgi:hypothetical protein